MSVYISLSCNDSWPGKPCSARISFTPHMAAGKAREKAAALGWSHSPSTGDLCPAHTRRRARDRERRGTA